MKTLAISNFLDVITRAFTEPRAPLKEGHPIYFYSPASPGIVYMRMISKNQFAYGTLGQNQDYAKRFQYLQ